MAKMLLNGKLAEKPVSSDGRFKRFDSPYRNWVNRDGEGGFPVEADRYHLFLSPACPWSHRAALMRVLMGLEDVISVSHSLPFMGEESWRMNPEGALLSDTFLFETYLRSDPHYTGPVTVPVLWDKKTGRIVNNESADIMRMLQTAFLDFADGKWNFLPLALREEMEIWNDFLQHRVNNGVYRVGFATSQDAYDEALWDLFDGLDELELLLAKRSNLVGDLVTEADWRLFTTLIRFDLIYYPHFKANLRRIADYPNLQAHLEKLYRWPGVAETVDVEHIKQHYYLSHHRLNPGGLIPAGPDFPFHFPDTQSQQILGRAV